MTLEVVELDLDALLEPPVQKRPVRYQPEPQKSSPSEIKADNVKSRKNQEKSDRKLPNDAGIIWKLSIGKQVPFPGSTNKIYEETGGFL